MLRKLDEATLPTHNAVEKLSRIDVKVFDKARGVDGDLYLIANTLEDFNYDNEISVGLYTSKRRKAKDTLIFVNYSEGTDANFINPLYEVHVNVGYDGETVNLSHNRAFKLVTDDENEAKKTFDRILTSVFDGIDLEELTYDDGSIEELQDVAVRAAKKYGLRKSR